MLTPMSPATHRKVVERFHQARVLIVGDVMLDAYVAGISERLSVEAPVPIVREEVRRFVLGGAGNVAANIAALGGRAVLIGVIGKDEAGRTLQKLVRSARIESHLIVDTSRPTTEKTRVVVGHHQVVRIDRERVAPVSRDIERKIIREIERSSKIDLVVFSDYAKGTVTGNVVRAAKRRCGPARVIADFKPGNARFYRNIGVILPNIKEAYGLTGIEARTRGMAERALERLAADFGTAVVLKRSEHGLSLLDPRGGGVRHIPTRAREVFDVTGAGDTVIAALGLAMAVGTDLAEATEIANHAAGIVVELEGTATASPQSLLGRLSV
jgi:rfaE bifunctional protein kinase chain/domain